MIARRPFLAGLAAALAAPGLALAREEVIAFDVLRGGDPIGSHVLTFSPTDEGLVVDVAIELEVVFAWVPVFRYSHANREIWRDGRLVRMASRTDDDGRHHEVTAEATAEGLVVTGDEGTVLAEPELLTTSYWNPETIRRSRLLDTQKGLIAEVASVQAGEETLAVAGQTVPAVRYDVSGDLTLSAWYDAQGRWCGLAFDARGSEVVYRAVRHVAADRWSALVAAG